MWKFLIFFSREPDFGENGRKIIFASELKFRENECEDLFYIHFVVSLKLGRPEFEIRAQHELHFPPEEFWYWVWFIEILVVTAGSRILRP